MIITILYWVTLYISQMRESILLICQAIPEWRDCYIDYRYLKVFITILTKLINQYIQYNQASETQNSSKLLTNIQEINSPKKNIQEKRKRLKEIIQQINNLFAQAFQKETKKCKIFCQIQFLLLKTRFQLCVNFKKVEILDINKKVTLLLPYTQYTYIEASYLKKMQDSNLEAERKILKKHKKYSQKMITTPATVLQKCLQLNKIKKLVNDIQDFYVDFADQIKKKQKKSKKKLKRDYIRSLTGNIQTSSKDSFIFGLWVGIFMAVILFMSLLLFYQKKSVQTNPIFNRDFPTWRGIAFIIFFIWVIGINLFCYQYFMISHRIILDFNEHHYSTSTQIFKIAGSLSTLFAAAFTVYALNLAQVVSLGVLPPQYLVLIPWATFLLFMFNPFPIFYVRTRIFIFKLFLKIIISPILGVPFVVTWATDQLLSLLTPFQDMVYTICYYSAQDFSDVYAVQNNCKNPAKIAVFVYGIIIFSYRIFQCMRQGWDKKKYIWEIQFFNTVKYLFSLLTLLFSYLWQSSYQNLFAAWLTFAISSTIYSYIWDLKMDWGILNFRATRFLLRDKLLYSSKSYYLFMISNLILRLAWVLTLSPNISNNLFGSPQLFRLLTGAIQILRRGIWNLLRMEKQQLKNSQEFKAIPNIRIDQQKTIYKQLEKAKNFQNSLSAKQMLEKQNNELPNLSQNKLLSTGQQLIFESQLNKGKIALIEVQKNLMQLQIIKKQTLQKLKIKQKQANQLIKYLNDLSI